MHLILTGATGLVGSGVLDAMIKMKEVTKISIISRRPVPMADDAKDPRIKVILHKDFTAYDKSLMDQLKDARGVVWALGISQTAVSKEEYVKITKSYTLAAAEAFQPLASDAQPFNFVYVSGDGATFEPGMLTPIFGRVKGETELALAAMRKATPAFHANTMRPSGVDWKDHPAIKPYMPAQGVGKSALAMALFPIIKTVAKSRWSPTEPLGKFLTEMAMGKWDEQFVEPAVTKISDFAVVNNVDWRKLAKLDDC